MLTTYSAAAVRAAEQPLLDAGQGPALMRAAAYGLAMTVASILRSRGGVYGATAVLLVGSGNNGGDALFAGAWLASHGTRTTALLTSSRTHPQALAAFVSAGGRCLALEDSPTLPAEPAALASFMAEAAVADVVLDGILGTGGTGGLRSPVAEIVAELDRWRGDERPFVVACDVPSGVDATTGEVHGPVLRADLTVTFGAHKSGLCAAPGEQLCGEVRLVDLGISDYLGSAETHRVELADMGEMLPRALANDHKYTRGVLGVVAGSQQYPGAALLAVAAASACGPGMVRYLGPEAVAAAIHGRNPEVVCSTNTPADVRVQAWVVGPGVDGDQQQIARAAAAMASGLPTVVDAGALELVQRAGAVPCSGTLILTPHAGELAALFARHGIRRNRADIEKAPLLAARDAARTFGAVVLLKGSTTIVASPGGTTFTQSNGSARLATAGSGDTLAGILGALLAMGPAGGPSSGHGDEGSQDSWTLDQLARTAALAAALHGELSQEDSKAPLSAGQLASRIPHVWAQLS